jgi:O-antigen/teichoic acid export membrane protein
MVSFSGTFFNGAMSTRAFVALKKMRYDLWVTITQGAALGGIFITLLLVWIMRDLRALVYGYIAEAFLKCVLSFIVCPFVPKLKFDKKQTGALFNFTRGMAGVPCLTFLFLQVDIFVLGTLVDKHSLGIYGMAGSLAALPVLLISVIVNPILMPAFAQLRGQAERINAALVKVTRIVSLLGFPVCAWVLLFGSEIMRIVYGPEYANAGHVLAILFFASFLRTLASPIPAIYIGIGQPAKNRVFTAVRTGIMLLLIYPGALYWGLTGAASAGAIAMILAWFFQARQMKTLSKLDTGIYSLSIVTGLFSAGAAAGISLLIRNTLGTSMLSLAITGVLCAAVILVTLAVVMFAGDPPVYRRVEQ